MSWLWLIVLIPIAVLAGIVFILFLWCIYVAWSERRRRLAAIVEAGETPCMKCFDVNVLNVTDLEFVRDTADGREFRCPKCGRHYGFNEIAFGGGRVYEIKKSGEAE
jgi:hypothetical protein